ncbi:uncharacterized protein LOC144433250 [Glandiceps talaboti]
MRLKTKKRLTNIATGIFFLMGGVEYAVILPSLWQYLQSLGAESIYLGLTLSAFSFSGLFAGPVFGKWHDKTGKVKTIILFGNLWEIVGNFMYFVGINKNFVVLSRLVAGVGSGAGAAIFAQITHTTTTSERTAAISLAMAARQIGLLLGPGLNFFLEHLNGYLGPWEINALTSPGIFMCGMWILMEFITLFMYYDLPSLEEQELILAQEDKDEEQKKSGVVDQDETEPLMRNACTNETVQAINTNSNQQTNSTSGIDSLSSSWQGKPIKQLKDFPPRDGLSQSVPTGYSSVEENESYIRPDVLGQGSNEHLNGQYGSIQTPASPETGEVEEFDEEDSTELKEAKLYASEYGSEKYPGKFSYTREFIREEIVVILTAQFFFMFNQTCLETILTPYTQVYLNFNELQNSVLYCVAGFEVMFMFVVIKFLSKKIEDRKMLLLGFVIEFLSIAAALGYMPNLPIGHPAGLPIFLIIFVVQVSGLPLIAACVASMFSKHTTERTQGFSQGVRRGVANIGTILGPLWAGGAISMLYVNIGVIVGLVFFILVMICLSWKRLKDPVSFWWLGQNARAISA